MVTTSEGYLPYELAQPPAFEPSPAIGLLNLADQNRPHQAETDAARESECARAMIKNQALFLLRHLERDVSQGDYSDEAQELSIQRFLVFGPWCRYLLDFVSENRCISKSTAEALEYLSATFLELVETDVIRKANTKLGLKYKKRGYTFRSGYARSGEVSYFLETIGTVQNIQFQRTNELLAHFYDVAWPKFQTVNDLFSSDSAFEEDQVVVQSPFTSLTELSHFRTIVEQSTTRLPKKIHTIYQINDQHSLWLTFDSAGKLLTHQGQANIENYSFLLSSISFFEIWLAVLEMNFQISEASNVQEKTTDLPIIQLTEVVNNHFYPKIGENADSLKESLSLLPPLMAFDQLISTIANAFEEWKIKMAKHRKHVLIRQEMSSNSIAQQNDALREEVIDHYSVFFKPLLAQFTTNLELCKSGHAANLAAFQFATRLVSPNPDEYVPYAKTKGWYYESSPPQNWRACDAHQARVLLVNIDPNEPSTHISSDAYWSDCQKIIADFCAIAAQNISEQFVIVIDKSNHLSQLSFFENIPSNVTVVQTASLMKHQNGFRHQFSGAIAVSSNHPNSKEFLADAARKTMSLATPLQIESWPLIDVEMVKDKRARLYSLSLDLAQQISDEQQFLPPDERWIFKAFNSYGFLVPPKKVIDLYNQEKQLNPDLAMKYAPLVLGDTAVWAINSILNRDAQFQNQIEKGDSYGLTTTRLALFESEEPLYPRSITACLRIGYGSETDFELVREFMSKLMQILIPASQAVLAP